MRAFRELLDEEIRRADAAAAPTPRAASAPSFEDALSAAVAAASPPAIEPPAWAKVLGAPFPCTPEQLKKSFKRAAFEAHPDRGGSNEAFIHVRRAHAEGEAALKTMVTPAPVRTHARAYAQA